MTHLKHWRDLIESMISEASGIRLFHGTSVPASVIMSDGLKPFRHGSVFLTDNPEQALDYALTDGDRSGSEELTVVSVLVDDLDQSLLTGDIDHTGIEDWQESLSETDQCMYRGAIPPSVLRIENISD